jgi:hypothetical protein
VVLRVEFGGGHIPFGYLATQAPNFTLYGDNTVIFRPTSDPGGTGNPPFVRAVMNSRQVDALLTFALTQGHLAAARESYVLQGLADGSTTYFTINAGGVKKVVGVYGLGMGDSNMPNPDAADFKAFGQLSDLLMDFEAQVRKGQVESAETYVPEKYRAVLMDGQEQEGGNPWPWADLKLADCPPDPEMSTRICGITAEQAAKVAPVPNGGTMNIHIASPDGKSFFYLSIRPLLPGDKIQPELMPGLGF